MIAQLLILLVLVLPSICFGQTTNSRTQDGSGTKITSTGGRLDVQTQTGLLLDATLTGRLAAAFASADNIAAQTTTAIHGLGMIWDTVGGNWDRWTGAVSQSGTWNIANISGTVSLPTGAATEATLGTLLLNSTYTGRMPAGASPADNESNTNTALSRIGVFNFVYDGATWDRWTGAVSQSGTWNIGTVTTLTGITNPVTVTDGSGALNVIVDSSALPSGASTLAEQQTQTTSLQLIDDIVHAANAALSKAALIGCQFDDVSPGSVTENNVSPVRCSTRRELYGQIRDAAGNERGANVNASNQLSVSIDGIVNEGQQTMANSISVAIASDQSTLNTIGTLADNGAAAGTNRVGVLPGIAASTYTAGTSGRNQALRTGTLSGNLFASNLPEPSIASYSASAVVASAASATDIAVLPGNATNTVLVTEVRLSCTQTTAGMVEVHLIKRGTADSGGTSSAMTKVPDDANYAAASSAPLTYTANPTINNTVGDVDSVKLGCMATGTTSPNDYYIANFRQKPIVLRGTAQQLAVNLNGATVSGGSFALTYKWIETTGP